MHYENTEYNKRNSEGDKLNENGIFGSVFTGIDYYIYEKLYIGAELGIIFNTGKKKNGSYTRVIGDKIISDGSVIEDKATKHSLETDYPVIETKGTYTKVYIEPSIRIGWMF